METLYFDSIDTEGCYFREQAYRFEQLSKDKFNLQVAVYNPITLLPFAERNTVPQFLRNLDAICSIGAKLRAKKTDLDPNANTFLANYAAGVRYLYRLNHEKMEAQKCYIAFATTVDFSQGTSLKENITSFSFDAHPNLNITNHEFSTYGSVYRMCQNEESDQTVFEWDNDDQDTYNMDQARAFEVRARQNGKLSNQYGFFKKSEGYETLGSFVVWGSSLITKKAASAFCLKNSMEFICLSSKTSDRNTESKYDAIKQNELLHDNSTQLTSPLNEPADLLNLMQVYTYAETGRSMFGPKEIKRAVAALQERYDAGDVKAWRRTKPDPATPLSLKIVDVRPELAETRFKKPKNVL